MVPSFGKPREQASSGSSEYLRDTQRVQDPSNDWSSPSTEYGGSGHPFTSAHGPHQQKHPEFVSHIRQPSGAGLHIHTNIEPAGGAGMPSTSRSSLDSSRGQLQPSPTDRSRPSLSSNRSLENVTGNASPASTYSSPALGALNDVTPLPSPLMRSGSPEMWKRMLGRRRGSSASSNSRDEGLGLLPPSVLSRSSSKKKKFPNLNPLSIATVHEGREGVYPNRSVSEFVPDALHNVRPRNVTDPSAACPTSLEEVLPQDCSLHREEDQAERRRSTVAHGEAHSLPSPPPSNNSAAGSDEADELQRELRDRLGTFGVHTGPSGEIQQWKPLRILGRGAFSQVILATSKDSGVNGRIGSIVSKTHHSQLVAIKIVAHAQASDADEERMDTSVRREIDILQSVSHPCLPRLVSFHDTEQRALLVLNYCPGGDLFELASKQRSCLTQALVQRIFAELVAAVGYLHKQLIVHRDIKLENVLVYLPPPELSKLDYPQYHPYPLINLTDLGLSKRIPPPPDTPLLHHFCGSADYAAPELLLQQPYDGRTTDMWAVGVLLYSLIEGRLPFDPLPGQRRAGNVKHRIARCDWMWCEYGDRNGEWNEEKGKGLEGAHQIVEGLLKKVGRGRWSEEKVAEHPWVRSGITVKEGLKFYNPDEMEDTGPR